MNNLKQSIALSCAFIGALFGCATPPDQDYERLCSEESGMVVYEQARLPAERFTPNGRVLELKGHPSDAFGPNYTVKYKGTELGPKGILRKSEASLYRNADGKLMARHTMFIKRVPSALGFEPKVYTCPSIGDSSFNKAFTQ